MWAARPSLGAKSGLADDFPQKFFRIIPYGHGNVGRGPRDLSKSGFKAGEKLSPPKKIAGEILKKIKTTFWVIIIFHFKSKRCDVFVSESAAECTPFYLL